MGIPIAHAITPIATICRIGRLRTVVSVSTALVHHSARILCILGDEWHQGRAPVVAGSRAQYPA
jgi:hypothetical protein